MAKVETVVEEGTPVYTYDFHHKKHGDGVLVGLVLVFIGIVFLLSNLGLVPSNIWNEVWKFWPVLFILFGLRLLGGRNFVSRIIITLITLFTFAGVLAYLLFYYGVFRNFGF
jgi:multisubunit Na+/H+ antiporter MnhB subunit